MPKTVKLRVISNNLKELRLPEIDAELFHDMLDAWQIRRLGSLRHAKKSVSRDILIVFDFVRFSNKAPWTWSEDDFEKWCHELGLIRRLAVSSQRHYQSVIRNFLRYILENVRFRNEVQRLYGITITQICHRDNCIPHVDEREMSIERRALTYDEIDSFFLTIDEMIDEAKRFGMKDFRPLQRDKALFYTMYIGGLRISETQTLDFDSFRENAKIPEFGKFGFISIWGKGSRGSGPRHRLVPIDHPTLPPTLQWYINYIRPHFMRKADPNEFALFISERGNRICISTIEARFQKILGRANLSGQHLTPHSLRHSSVTHGALLLSSEAVRRKHGHTYQSTTQGYMHIPDEYVRDEFDKSTRHLLDRVKKTYSKKDNNEE